MDKSKLIDSFTYNKIDLWHSINLEKLPYQAYKVLKHNDIYDLKPDANDALALLSFLMKSYIEGM